MKTLFLARHAKSSWKLPEVEDLDRPLMEKGLIKTQETIAFLLKNNINIEMIISSHAKRALETAKLYANAFKYPIKDIEINTSIYYSGTEGLYNAVYGIPDNINSVMIVGHNPVMTQFSNFFTEKFIDCLPTSAIVSIEFNTDKWTEIDHCPHKIKFIIFPKKV